jgi:hypothetical protein
MNNRTPDSHYPWTKKWGAGQEKSISLLVFSLLSSSLLSPFLLSLDFLGDLAAQFFGFGRKVGLAALDATLHFL